MTEDRRDSYRFLMEKEDVYIENPSSFFRARIDNISASGSGLTLLGGKIDELEKGPVFLKLGPYPALETRIIPTRIIDQNGFINVGGRFQDMEQEALRSLSRFLAECFLENSQRLAFRRSDIGPLINRKHRKAISELLRYHCIFQSRPLTIYYNDHPLPSRLLIRNLSEEADHHYFRALMVAGKEVHVETGREYDFTFAGSNAVNYFKSKLSRIESDSLIFNLPTFIHQSGFRDSLRVSPNPSNRIELILRHPRLHGISLTKPVIEMSARGVVFPILPESDVLFPGESLSGTIINLPEGPVRVEGTIRSIRDQDGQPAYGFEIIRYFNEDEKTRWLRHIFLTTYQRLKIGKKEDASAFWSVLESSNYIKNEVTPSLVPLIRRRFFIAWDKHSENPWITHNLLFYRKQKPVAAISISRIYPKTSLGHHMSVDNKIRKGFFDVGREVICGMTYITRHLLTTEYYISYFYADKTYNRLMFKGFLRRYPINEDFLYDRYHLYKCLIEKAGNENADHWPGDVDITPGDPGLLRILSSHLKDNLSKIEYEAFSYSAHEITLESFSEQCLSYGYERKRRIFFALKKGIPLAALIAETGDEGINTFNLLNCCWVVFLEPMADQDEQLLDLLMKRTIRFYREEGKNEFIFMEASDSKPRSHMEKYGVRYVTDGMRWLGNDRLLSAYLNYIEETLGMLFHNFKPYQ